jgi:F-type H+-transporting ATPase subunit delta
VHENTLAKRYATALADLAADENLLDQVGDQLTAFAQTLDDLPPLRNLMVSPISAKNDQQTALTIYLDKAQITPITQNFLRLLISKRRISLISAITAAYNRERDLRNNRITVKIRTPIALTQQHASQLKTNLAEKTGKSVDLDISLEPNLLGGIIVQVGSVMLDYTVRSRLNRLKATMKG